MPINTETFSLELRARTVDLEAQRIRITNFRNSAQEPDLTKPPNCAGFGRIRHFRRFGSKGWPDNPLPMDPAAHRLSLNSENVLMAQVFQNASCNWRCWYCYVPFNLLSANPKYSSWLTAKELLDLYDKEEFRARVIDLSGGQPDLTPEWVPWMMRELGRRGLADQVYLWSDDNLSNDFFWRFLSRNDLNLIQSYRNYGKVCCFKGFSPDSFAFNTKAERSLFNQQFELFRKYIEFGLDLYAYATFTTPDASAISSEMECFVDMLQSVSSNLPLRVVPLEISSDFHPTKRRITPELQRAVSLQWNAIGCWKRELERRFPTSLRTLPVYEVPL